MIQQSPTLAIKPSNGNRQLDVSALWWPGYSRESLAIGGDFRASTSFEVPMIEADKWKEMLGWYFEERWGSVSAFQGRVHSVLVDVAGSVSVASLDNVWNAVRVKYKARTLPKPGEELVINGGFETAASTSAYVFEGWGELGSDGVVARVSAIKHSGTYCCRVTAGASANMQVGSTYRVRPGKTYVLSFWTRGDGTYAGRYEVFNNDTNTNLISLTSTGIPGFWGQIVVEITIPDGCNSISVRLRCPGVNGQNAYFDDVSLRAYEIVDYTTNWDTDDESIARFGRMEKELSPKVITDDAGAEALLSTYLARHAWPENEPQRLGDSSSPNHATVTITIKGHIQGLNSQRLDDTSTALVNADDAVRTALAAASTPITAGDIRANSAVQISEESDGEVIWERLKEIAEFGDNSEQYLIGCYAGTRLDYKPINRSTISYMAEMGDDGVLHYFDTSNREIPGAIMRPGLIVWRHDLRPGIPRRTPFTDDTRATLIGSVTIRRGSVSISALNLNEAAFLHGLINSISRGD